MNKSGCSLLLALLMLLGAADAFAAGSGAWNKNFLLAALVCILALLFCVQFARLMARSLARARSRREQKPSTDK